MKKLKRIFLAVLLFWGVSSSYVIAHHIYSTSGMASHEHSYGCFYGAFLFLPTVPIFGGLFVPFKIIWEGKDMIKGIQGQSDSTQKRDQMYPIVSILTISAFFCLIRGIKRVETLEGIIFVDLALLFLTLASLISLYSVGSLISV